MNAGRDYARSNLVKSDPFRVERWTARAG